MFWRFTKGAESIYLVREESAQACRLQVHGSGPETVTYEFPDLVGCIRQQEEIERKLMAEGFQLMQFGTAGHGIDLPKGPDADDGGLSK